MVIPDDFPIFFLYTQYTSSPLGQQLTGQTMGKRNRYRDHMDPEYQRLGRTYPRFPGLAECCRLIRAGKAKMWAWGDIITYEMAENAAICLPELIETFRSDPSDNIRLYIMTALELAHLPESVPFLGEVLQQGNPLFSTYALRALEAIDTRESRTNLWQLNHEGSK